MKTEKIFQGEEQQKREIQRERDRQTDRRHTETQTDRKKKTQLRE